MPVPWVFCDQVPTFPILATLATAPDSDTIEEVAFLSLLVGCLMLFLFFVYFGSGWLVLMWDAASFIGF